MAQLTLYVPDALEKQLRRAARKTRKSLSAYVADLARSSVSPSEWPASFLKTYGSSKGDIREPIDLPLEERDAW
jgi:hypothetical protein